MKTGPPADGAFPADGLISAREQALRYVSRSHKTMREAALKLRELGHSNGVIKETLAFLIRCGYINDKKYAEEYISEKTRQGYAKARIRRELKAKGIPDETVDAAFEAAESACGTSGRGASEALRAAVKKRFGNRAPDLSDGGERRRTAAYLARRGFTAEEINGFFRETVTGKGQ